MANGKTRPRRYYLQRLVGDRGTVYFIAVPDPRHRAVGWYVDPSSATDGCLCEFCLAARDETPVFAGGNSFLAAKPLHDYADAHPLAERQATG